MSLAGFNILFGIQEGDLITGLFLSVAWAILAVIELSIIQLQTELNQIIEAASSKYEKMMYFRMASWFMKDADSSFEPCPRRPITIHRFAIYLLPSVSFLV